MARYTLDYNSIYNELVIWQDIHWSTILFNELAIWQYIHWSTILFNELAILQLYI